MVWFEGACYRSSNKGAERLSERGTTIWLHGAGMNGETWGDVCGVTPDLPGHGVAPRAQHASVEAFADTLFPGGDAPVALVGHSLGGMVALELAARMGARVRAVVLIDAPLWLPCGPFMRFAEPLAHLTSLLPGPRGIAHAF